MSLEACIDWHSEDNLVSRKKAEQIKITDISIAYRADFINLGKMGIVIRDWWLYE